MTSLNSRKATSGFTLVEMAIVLVIIGIILAGVMKGRDIVRSSQVKQFSQGFAQKWVTIAQTYYDKTGQQITDGPINGGSANAPDGLMDGYYPGRTAGGQNAENRNTILGVLKGAGIDPCTIIKSDKEDLAAGTNACANTLNIYARSAEGEFTGKVPVGVGFTAVDLTVAGTKTAMRNAVFLVGVPLDVAMGIDTVIDGQARGDGGSVIFTGKSVTAQPTTAPQTATWAGGGASPTPPAETAAAWPAFDPANPLFVDFIILLDS